MENVNFKVSCHVLCPQPGIIFQGLITINTYTRTYTQIFRVINFKSLKDFDVFNPKESKYPGAVFLF